MYVLGVYKYLYSDPSSSIHLHISALCSSMISRCKICKMSFYYVNTLQFAALSTGVLAEFASKDDPSL